MEFVNNKAVSALIGVLFFILATTLGAYVRIPLAISPVPITLQTFFVMLAGAVLGRKLGAASQAGYYLLGFMGIPVFQGFSFGLSCIMGPTGGYLIGFIAAAFLIASMTGSSKPGIFRIVAAFAIGDILIHLLGAAWLACLYRLKVSEAVSVGILPFIPGEIVKIGFASLIYSRISQRSKVIFRA